MNCLIPIAFRFVASDQWLTAQLDPTWKISEVKQYILSKVYNRPVTNIPSQVRPVSPITFASARNSFDSNPDDLLEYDPTADYEPNFFVERTRPLRTRPSQTSTQRVTSPFPGSPTEPLSPALPPNHYSMLAFSTGQLLEDDYSLAWYHLRPHELLELHPPGMIVPLQREVMLEYVKPYLEFDVRALRVIVNDKDTHALGPASAPDSSSPNKAKRTKEPVGISRSPSTATGGGSGSVGSPAALSMRKRRKLRLEWRDRYLVIHRGMLSLFKSRTDLMPVHTCSLAMLTTLRGQEDVLHAAASYTPSPHVVCAKFRDEGDTPSVPEPQPSSSLTPEQRNDIWSGGTIPRESDGFLGGRRESKEDVKQQRGNAVEGSEPSRGNTLPKEDTCESRMPDSKTDSSWYDMNVGDGTRGTWLVVDTLDGFAHSNLLRVLHRCSPDTTSTTLIPSHLLPDSSPSSLSPPLSSHSGTLFRSSCPYPEWRIEVCQRARKSGLGDVSDAMSWILWGSPPLERSDPKPDVTEPRKPPQFATEDSGAPFEPFDFDGDVDGGDDDDCDLEWDSWANDLTRQALANLSNNIAVTVTEPASVRPNLPRHRIRPSVSSPTFSSVALPEQQQCTPISHNGIPAGANMGLLSLDSPALLTAPSVLPFQGTGLTTSTVSAGGVVRTRSLMSVDGGRGRGVARAMEVLSEHNGGGGGGGGFSPGKGRLRRQKRRREENSRGATIASSAPAQSMATASTANTITSTVTVHESGTPSSSTSTTTTRPHCSSLFAEVSSRPATATAVSLPGGGMPPDAASVISGVSMTTTTTTTTIQLLPRRSSMVDERLPKEATGSMPSSSSSQKRGDKAAKGKGKGKGKQAKSSSRGKAFNPERLVSKLDSALDFVTG